MNITYTQNGDYLIPNIIIRKTKPLGALGQLEELGAWLAAWQGECPPRPPARQARRSRRRS